MRQLCHRFILFLLRVSKSKYQLIEPIEHIAVDYKQKEIMTVQESFSFNDRDLLRHEMLPLQVREFIERKIVSRLIKSLQIAKLVKVTQKSTNVPLERIIIAEIKVVKP